MNKKALQTNIVVNGLNDTKLRGANTVQCHMHHFTAMLV